MNKQKKLMMKEKEITEEKKNTQKKLMIKEKKITKEKT